MRKGPRAWQFGLVWPEIQANRNDLARLILTGIILSAVVLLALAPCVLAQGPAIREDAIWARNALAAPVLDGVLDEPAWAQAESVIVQWAVDAGIPGSGWKVEAGLGNPTDPTYATLKFLSYGNQIYLGARVQDAYVGGSSEFNRFDGFLMAIKDHLDSGAPKPPSEYLYSWWYEGSTDPQPPGQLPAFKGRWAEEPPGSPRTPEQIDAWDAATVVHGLSNDDTVLDEGYTVEMRFNLTPMGYDITQPDGDVLEWNISIYDCDGFWPITPQTFAANRVWWQGPWGNAAWYSEARLYARPDVTINSGSLPTLEPELVIQKLTVAPTIDGALSEAVWSHPLAYTFDIRYGDDALRQTYPAVGPFRAGQYQPPVNGGEAFVADPGDATVKMFTVGDFLYMGFDVRDQFVQYHADFNRWDGFLITINDVSQRGPDNELLDRRLSFQVNEDGTALPQDYLTTMVTDGDAQVAIMLKPGTTVDTLGVDIDTGFTAELAIDLTALGYPSGLGDGTFFFGVNLLDGDSFDVAADSYGERTWFARQYEGECCPLWSYLSPIAVGVGDQAGDPVLHTYGYAQIQPNPSLQPRLMYWLPEPNIVTLDVYDVRGSLIQRQEIGAQPGGTQEIPLVARKDLSSGVYLYRLRLQDPATGAVRSTLTGKTLVVK